MSHERTINRAIPTVLAILAVALGTCADVPAAGAPGVARLSAAAPVTQPVRLTFTKCAIAPGVWEGTVSGDINGDLRTELTDLHVTGSIWQVRFDWIIDAGPESFVADLSGILNTGSGAVVMNGSVVSGYLPGAQVYEEGQLIDAENLCFEGSIRIMPSSAP
jgi:hypothetical protein